MREEALGRWSGLRLRSPTYFTNTYYLVIIMPGTVVSISHMLAHFLLIINLWNMYYIVPAVLQARNMENSTIKECPPNHRACQV